jgi:hypothetical protein
MFKVGDRVKLLSDDCSCVYCLELRENFHTILDTSPETIKFNLKRGKGVAFPDFWEWELEIPTLENK